MSTLPRLLVGAVVFAAIYLFGVYVLGIQPSLAEALLVSLAASFSIGFQEGLR